MNLIDGLYGDVAVLVLCGVLFANESGVPLPTNGELVLITGGILIGTGALDPWLFVPLAIVATMAGAFTGYSWARLVGDTGLQAVAERIGQGRRLAKLRARFGKAGPVRIALSRLTPGFRTYTSLVAGAVGVDRLRFVAGVGPVIVVWVVVYTVLGALVGAPISHYLTQLQNVVLQGGLLIVVGAGAYLAVRRVPAAGRAALARLPNGLRVVLAVLVDVAMIATVVSGALAILGGVLMIADPLLPIAAVAWWVELLAIVVVIAIFYSVATRRGVTATAGEMLLDTRYLTGRGAHQDRRRRAASPAELVRMSEVFRSLADMRRLRVARLLLQRDASAADVAAALSLSPHDAATALRDLEEAGLAAGRGEDGDRRFSIASDHVRLGLAELLAHVGSD